MRYRDLKDERDAAIARAVEAERLSMKSEFNRITVEFEQERACLLAQVSEDVKESYQRGFNDGLDAAAQEVAFLRTLHSIPATDRGNGAGASSGAGGPREGAKGQYAP